MKKLSVASKLAPCCRSFFKFMLGKRKRPTGAIIIRLARQRGLGVRLRTAAARIARAASHLPFPKNFSKGREISKKQNNQSVNIRLIRQIRERTDLANALFSANRFEMVNRLFCQDSAAAGSDDQLAA